MLLDTHVLIWWLEGNPRVERLEPILLAHDSDVRVSVVSLWEILMKVRAGKLRLKLGWIMEQIELSGWRLLPLDLAHVRVLETLPIHHKDPLDHLLIAQAIAENLTLITDDRHLQAYPVAIMPCAP